MSIRFLDCWSLQTIFLIAFQNTDKLSMKPVVDYCQKLTLYLKKEKKKKKLSNIFNGIVY